MSETAFDGAWRSVVVNTLGVPADHALVRDLQIVIEQWQQRCAAMAKPGQVGSERTNYRSALKHFRAMESAICRARGTTAWVHIDSRPWRREFVAPGIAMVSLEAYLNFYAENGSGSRTAPNCGDSLLIHQIAGIWAEAGKRVPKTWDARSSRFSRFVEFVVAGNISKRAADRGLQRYFEARAIYAVRNRRPVAAYSNPPA